MKNQICCIVVLLLPLTGLRAQPESLDELRKEVIAGNPGLKAMRSEVAASQGRASQMGTLDPPMLTYMREDMPGFRFGEAMASVWEVMQMIPFPSRLTTGRAIGDLQVQRTTRQFGEEAGMVVLELERMYFELWYVQHQQKLVTDNLRLVSQLLTIASARYASGEVPQQDLLRGEIERSLLSATMVQLRNEEVGLKSSMQAMLDRSAGDTLGTAVIGDEILPPPPLDSILSVSVRSRPMILVDSLEAEEMNAMLTLMRDEYFPDLTIGIGYVESPMTGASGWSVKAGISLPFVPWTLSKTDGRIDEAEANLQRARYRLTSTIRKIHGEIITLHGKAEGILHRVESFRTSILPTARQMLELSLNGYRTGTTTFLMLIEAYTMYNMAERESLMSRMEYEQARAALIRESGLVPYTFTALQTGAQQ